jgi:hypothetical protein
MPIRCAGDSLGNAFTFDADRAARPGSECQSNTQDQHRDCVQKCPDATDNLEQSSNVQESLARCDAMPVQVIPSPTASGHPSAYQKHSTKEQNSQQVLKNSHLAPFHVQRCDAMHRFRLVQMLKPCELPISLRRHYFSCPEKRPHLFSSYRK